MRNAFWKVTLVSVVLLGSGSVAACGGGDSDVSQFQKGADSMMTRRDSTIARMDSVGVVQADTTRLDSTRADSARRDTSATKRP